MLVFDQLNRRQNELRWLAWTMIAGMLILLGGLCYVQVLSSNHYVRSQNTQYYRTVRMPALRGRILDRHGVPIPDILSITLSHPNAKTTSMLNSSLAEIAILCIKHGEIDYAKRTLDIILYGYREGLGCKIKKSIKKLLRKSKQFMHR